MTGGFCCIFVPVRLRLLGFDEVVSGANWCGDGVAHGDERGLAFEAKLLNKRTEGMVCLVKIALGLRQVRVVRQGANAQMIKGTLPERP